MTDIDYDKLCADPAYRAEVQAAHKAGLRIELRNPRAVLHSGWAIATKRPAWAWSKGWQYRIAPGQQWPIPESAKEPVKAREWWLRIGDHGGITGVDDQQFPPPNWAKSVKVREVLPGDDDLRTQLESALEGNRAGRLTLGNLRAVNETLTKERDKLRAEVADLKRNVGAYRELHTVAIDERNEALAKITDLKRQLAEAAQERDAALIELGRQQINITLPWGDQWDASEPLSDAATKAGQNAANDAIDNLLAKGPFQQIGGKEKKITARTAEGGVIPSLGLLPQSVFNSAPEWVNFAHATRSSGVVIWTEFECEPKIPGWVHSVVGQTANSGIVIRGVPWQFSQTIRHRP